ncbi:hypothetical protein MKX01_018184 [Papaver californicum]|nr:hypothetical protein MKX01_018184 [Papaver californicum]
MKMGSSSMKIVMALALCLLLLGGFSAEAAGRINDGAAAAAATAITTEGVRAICVHPEEKCPGNKDCNSCCTSLGYIPGRELAGLCCCVEYKPPAMKV